MAPTSTLSVRPAIIFTDLPALNMRQEAGPNPPKAGPLAGFTYPLLNHIRTREHSDSAIRTTIHVTLTRTISSLPTLSAPTHTHTPQESTPQESTSHSQSIVQSTPKRTLSPQPTSSHPPPSSSQPAPNVPTTASSPALSESSAESKAHNGTTIAMLVFGILAFLALLVCLYLSCIRPISRKRKSRASALPQVHVDPRAPHLATPVVSNPIDLEKAISSVGGQERPLRSSVLLYKAPKVFREVETTPLRASGKSREPSLGSRSPEESPILRPPYPTGDIDSLYGSAGGAEMPQLHEKAYVGPGSGEGSRSVTGSARPQMREPSPGIVFDHVMHAIA